MLLWRHMIVPLSHKPDLKSFKHFLPCEALTSPYISPRSSQALSFTGSVKTSSPFILGLLPAQNFYFHWESYVISLLCIYTYHQLFLGFFSPIFGQCMIEFHAFITSGLHYLSGRNLSMSAGKVCVSIQDASDVFFSLLAQGVIAVKRTSARRYFFRRKFFCSLV